MHARRRVHNAKVALGERGRAWWLEPSAAARNLRIDAAILALLHSRNDGASICPSEAARIVGGKSRRALTGPAAKLSQGVRAAVDLLGKAASTRQ